MTQPPPGQGPIDPQGAFSPPPAPGTPGSMPPGSFPPGMPPPPPGFYGPPMMPPMMQMMPPGYMMPPPPPRRRGFSRWVFGTLATVILAGSILVTLFVVLMLLVLLVGKDMQEQAVVQKGELTNRIAIITLDGLINEAAYQKFHKSLKAVEDDSTARALVVEIDSPGGTITASDEIYHDLMLFKTRPGKTLPVVVSQKSLAASGGYYVSCAADYIIAEPSTMTGNIGVLFERFNVSGLLDKWGIQETTLKSKASPFKNAESMFKPESPEANAYLQTLVDEAYTQFAGVVKAGRSSASNALKGNLADIANGKIYTADQAYKLGLIDQIDYPEAAYAVAAKRAGLTGTPTVYRVKEMPTMLEMLTGRLGIDPATARSPGGDLNVELNGVKIDSSAIYELLSPRMLYLWNGG